MVRLVEKPTEPATDLALVGVYMFTASIHDAARAIEPSARGELEITDAIQHLVDGGKRVEPHIVRGWWKDTGRLDDMLEANRLILDNLVERIDGELIDSQVDGRVVIEAGARLERTTVRGPAVIGAGARLSDCYIGPYTAIGENCRIAGAEVEHSILLDGCIGVRPRRADGVLAARAQRDGAPRRAPADAPTGSWSETTPTSRSCERHEPRDRRGRDARPRCAARGGARRHARAAAGRSAGARHHRRAGGHGRSTKASARTRRSTARPGPTSTGPRRTRDQAHAVNADGAGNLARAAAAIGDAAAPRLDRLRVRRDRAARRGGRAAPVRRVRPDRPALGVRGDQARGRAAGARGLAPPHGRAHAPGCSVSTARTSPRRCCGWQRSATSVQVVTDQVGSPTWTGHLAPALIGLLEREVSGLVHLAGSGRGLLERLRAGDLPPGRGRLPRRAGEQRADGHARRRDRRGRCSSPSATTCCRCPPGRTGWRDTWRPARGSRAHEPERATSGGGWDDVPMKLLVCGGAGFIGSTFARMRLTSTATRSWCSTS